MAFEEPDMMEDRVSINQGAGKGYGVEECQFYGYEYIFGLHHISLEDNIPDPQSHLKVRQVTKYS